MADFLAFVIFPMACYTGSALLLGYLAGRRNRDKWRWALIGGLALLPALVVLLLLPRREPQQVGVAAGHSWDPPDLTPIHLDEIRCWSCKQSIPVTPETRGKKVACLRCKTKQQLPL